MCSSNNATSKENNVNDKIDLDNVFDKLTSMTPDRLEKVMDKFNLAQERQRQPKKIERPRNQVSSALLCSLLVAIRHYW